MENTKPKFALKDIRKQSQVLRAAAEVISYDMLTTSARSECRYGCCAAFDEISDQVYEKFRNKLDNLPYATAEYYATQQRRGAAQLVVNEAKELFEDLYKPEAAEWYSYWMGKGRTNQQQERRMAALLSAAEVAEAEGK